MVCPYFCERNAYILNESLPLKCVVRKVCCCQLACKHSCLQTRCDNFVTFFSTFHSIYDFSRSVGSSNGRFSVSGPDIIYKYICIYIKPQSSHRCSAWQIFDGILKIKSQNSFNQFGYECHIPLVYI